jgi:hypothetical protein
MERAVVDEYGTEILVEEGAENAVTTEMILGLLYVRGFPEKKAEQDRIFVIAELTPLRPDRRIPVSFRNEKLLPRNDCFVHVVN